MTQAGAVERVSVDRAAATVLTVAAGGVALLMVMPPGDGAVYPACPFLALTGLDCPFCGGLRGTYALVHGDVAAALDHNILVPFWALLVAVGGAWWAVRRLRGPVVVNWSARVQRMVLTGSLVMLGVFWVVRNLPQLPYLDSGGG